MNNLSFFYSRNLWFLSILLGLCFYQTGFGQPVQHHEFNNNERQEKMIPNEKYAANWASLDQRKTPAWFEDAKFGIFIHWGVFSVPSWAPTGDLNVYSKYAEWYWRSLLDENRRGHDQFVEFHNKIYGEDFRYQDFAPMFTAEMFEPDEWAKLFEKAGAKYVVLTSKHHEGFCLWPSEQSWNWNSVDVGPHRDLAGDLTKAVKEVGLRMGFYYSLYEWYNPLYHNDLEKYVDTHMIPQMKDLITRYEPDVFWTDGEWEHPSAQWKSEEFLAWLYNKSPVREKVAVNDRWGKETRSKHGGYYTTEYGLVHEGEGIEDESHAWEECRGIGGSFGYNRNEDLQDYASSEQLVHLLIDLVSKGGNLLLNVGPTADGRIPVIMQQRLLDMGRWLGVNGEAIYGTRKWRVSEEGDMIRYTQKESDVYAICKKWPGKQLTLNAPEITTGKPVTLLGYDKSLKWKKQGNSIVVDLSPLSVGDVPVEYAYVFKLQGAK